MTFQSTRTLPSNLDFLTLIELLDKEIQARDGENHTFFAQFNTTEHIKNAILIYYQGIAVGCGSFKFYQDGIAEIKRMFVHPSHRGKGIASEIIKELTTWAKEERYTSCILETGHQYPEAIALYKKNGFSIIPNYGQYESIADSICFRKIL